MVFGSDELPEHEITQERLDQVLADIKRQARDRRIAMVAPVVLAAAVLVAFVAAPPQHGGITLVPEADASDENVLPRVFGSNGVWRLAEPIGEPLPSMPGPPWMVEVPDEPSSPEFVLVAPDEEPEASESLPVSASSPPTPTLGQPADADPDEPVDWSAFQPEIRVEPPPVVSDVEPAVEPGDQTGEISDTVEPLDQTVESSDTAEPAAAPAEPAEAAVESTDDGSGTQVSPEAPAPAEATTPPTGSSPDEDVTAAGDPQSALTDDAEATTDPVADPADVGNPPEANPSTPQTDSLDQAAPPVDPIDGVATIVAQSVLVHRAHVSVTVQVVDDDSSVIDWCNTRVDWGDGSVTGLVDPGGDASCTAPCEQEASPSAVGLSEEVTFTHEYSVVIDAAPRVFVATGDGCSYRLAEMQLNPFTVVPY